MRRSLHILSSFRSRRIPPFVRPLRPPNLPPPFRVPTRFSRLFTHNSQLLLVAGRLVTRPQLPFLHPVSRRTSQSFVQRLLSTEAKARWKQRLRWQLRFHAYFWPASALCVLLIAGVHQTKLEHDYPTPREWTFWSRWFLRSGKNVEFDEDNRGLVDWGQVGWFYGLVRERLEDGALDGGSLLGQGDDAGGILVEGVGRTGWDVSMKSENWRRGYWEVLMGCGRVSERLEGLVRKKGTRRKRDRMIPRECVVGPNNERPRPMPWGIGEAWREDEVEEAFQPPEKFYLRILTTKGFTTSQRVEAALAYADWCDFKGLRETAQRVLEWGMDIAVTGAYDGKVQSGDIVDRRTGVVSSKGSGAVTANILKVSTAMGVHFAQSRDVKRALPVFLSLLQARKDLPPEPAYALKAEKQEQEVGIWSYLYALKDLLVEAPYPPIPPSGDEQPYHTLKEACEEVGLMTYVGEILYTTSSKEKGLGWTRDAVDAAEAILWVMKEENKEDGKPRCQECLQTGLDNWKKMAKSLAVAAEQEERDVVLKNKTGKRTTGWFESRDSAEKEQERAHEKTKKWQEEEMQIELRKQKTMPLITSLRPVKMGWFSV